MLELSDAVDTVRSDVVGQSLVGTYEDARLPVYDQVINAAGQDYETLGPSKRFWLSVGLGGYRFPEAAGSS